MIYFKIFKAVDGSLRYDVNDLGKKFCPVFTQTSGGFLVNSIKVFPPSELLKLLNRTVNILDSFFAHFFLSEIKILQSPFVYM